MPHTHRFHCPNLDAVAAGGELALPEAEARHAVSVLRLRPGDRVGVFDGHGLHAEAEFLRGGRAEAVVRVESLSRQAAPPVAVCLAPAWPQRDKVVDEIVCRGTELGVAEFHFWRAERSQRAPAAPDRWRRHAVESCKQCGRAALPALRVWDSLGGLLDGEARAAVVAADLDDGVDGPVHVPRGTDRILLLVGPEGDFSDRERSLLAERHVLRARLGALVLRTEAASVALATLALNAAGQLGARIVFP